MPVSYKGENHRWAQNFRKIKRNSRRGLPET
jgi:hypothetical protein